MNSVTRLPRVSYDDLADGVLEPSRQLVDDAGIEENFILHVNDVRLERNTVLSDVTMEGSLGGTSAITVNDFVICFTSHQTIGSFIAPCPAIRTVKSVLHFAPWQTCAIERHLDLSGKRQATLQLMLLPPLVC